MEEDMYKNVFGEKVSRARYKEMVRAQKNRREIVAAQLPRRDMMKMGLLTSAGYLVAKSGLTAAFVRVRPHAGSAGTLQPAMSAAGAKARQLCTQG